MQNIKLLLVDDDKNILSVYAKILMVEGYDVLTAENGNKGLATLKENDIDCVITDIYMPQMGGIDFIIQIKKLKPDVQILVITGQASIKNAINVMKKGAYSYIEKPIDIDSFLIELTKISELINTNNQNKYLKKSLNMHYGEFVGVSEKVVALKKLIPIVANSCSNVLITGESGTGKEVLAHQIHLKSKRSGFPMIKVNCASLAESLLESELFGHEKGAFTGALETKKGLFEIANKSTLFLDEIGEMSTQMQAKLLRVLQEKNFMRVGGHKVIYSDFRLIAATNKDLETEVLQKRFRADLFYRLNVIPVNIPPLRSRKEDIATLSEYFLKTFSCQMGKSPVLLTDLFIRELKSYSWPGNVRELKNIIERLMVFSENGYVDNAILKSNLAIKISMHASIGQERSLEREKEDFEKKYIIQTLIECDWNISHTAKKLGISRKNLYAKIKKYDIKADD